MSEILDTRDLAKRLSEFEDLETILNDAKQVLADFHNDTVVPDEDSDERQTYDDELEKLEQAVEDAESDFGTDEQEELEELQNLESEVSEWSYGATLIPEDDWEDYCRQLVEDIGDLPSNLPAYIENNIDWNGVAQDLKADYSEVTYQGETYLVRDC